MNYGITTTIRLGDLLKTLGLKLTRNDRKVLVETHCYKLSAWFLNNNQVNIRGMWGTLLELDYRSKDKLGVVLTLLSAPNSRYDYRDSFNPLGIPDKDDSITEELNKVYSWLDYLYRNPYNHFSRNDLVLLTTRITSMNTWHSETFWDEFFETAFSTGFLKDEGVTDDPYRYRFVHLRPMIKELLTAEGIQFNPDLKTAEINFLKSIAVAEYE